jgi:hypothetical protein
VIPVQSNLDLRVVLSLIEEREARLRRTNLLPGEPHADRRRVRRWIGRQLVRFGTRLAGEPTMRPVRAR